MPIYEYECTECGNVEEIFQKMSDSPLVTCQQCQGELHKIISHSSFHLKGSGWYATDYGGSASKGAKASQNKKAETKKDTSCSSSNCKASCSTSKTKE